MSAYPANAHVSIRTVSVSTARSVSLAAANGTNSTATATTSTSSPVQLLRRSIASLEHDYGGRGECRNHAGRRVAGRVTQLTPRQQVTKSLPLVRVNDHDD